MKPVINLSDLNDFEIHENGPFRSKHAGISELIGAKRLGYSLTMVPPGHKVCPFHNHRINEEMFFILEGKGILRFGSEEYPLKKHDVVACPPGGPEVAHQIINTGESDIIYLSLATKEPVEVVEYPDSNKVLSVVGEEGAREFSLISRREDEVDYFHGEK
ncbi:Uncharacterized conserved protein, cupin superfamily [Alteromonadaceae bacterium Bs31]|nr:Uncharacterized conserved protein, cupin superfamily [Alteromonadaceae bacterium Bs31]